MNRSYPKRHDPLPYARSLHLVLVSLVTLLLSLQDLGQAQTPPLTPSGLDTQISDPIAVGGQTQYDITGGTRPGGASGTNLFHSFGDFSVPTNNIANFLNLGSVDLDGNPLDAGLPTSNILGRVTGGDPSVIFGIIQTNGPNGFGNANLFLMNPAGFLFGPNATVNVGGMMTFTSADYLKLTDNAQFNAIPNGAADALLTAFPIASFGFLGPNAASIAIQGGTLEVPDGKTLAFIGGPRTFTTDTGVTVPAGVTMTGGSLSALNGLIYMATVTTPGEVPVPTLSGAPLGTLGPPSSAPALIRIRSGEFVMDQATISADTVTGDVDGFAIDINVTGNMSVTALDVPALTARTTGSGNAGEIRISSGTMDVTATTFDNFLFSVIDAHTSGLGNAGNVTIETAAGGLAITGDPFGLALFIDSGTTGPGHGGDVTITATGQSVQMQDIYLSTGNFIANIFGEDATGAAGNVAISADSVHLTFSGIDTSSFSITNNTGQAGDISVTARDIQLESSLVQALGFERGGAINVNADRVLLSDSRFETQTILNQGGGIAILAKTVDFTQGSQLISVTGGDGDAGSITVSASEHIGILEGSRFVRPSGIFTQSFGTFGSGGNAGDIFITTPQLEVTAGGRINTVTKSSGRGGNVTINATDSVSISGEFPDDISEPLFNLGPIHQSGIFTSTVGGKCAGSCGDAGRISITTGSVIMGSGSQIDSGTSSTGRGGDITIHTTNQTSMSGTLSDGSPVGILSRTIGTDPGSGSGGNIALTAGQSVTISNGATVSASSTGSGNAGNITIQGLASPAQSVLIDGPGSGIFTDTEGTGAGGNIFVNADSVLIENGGTLSAVTSGNASSASGGTISVHANHIQLNNQATITATSGGAGNAGTIMMAAEENIVLLGNSSIASAAEGEGNGGLVSLTAPSIEMHGNSDIGTSTAGLGNAGDIELQGNQVNLTESFVRARTQAEGRGGNITIRGLTGEGSRATDVRLADTSQLVSETSGDGEHIQGAAGNILVETARLNLSGRSLFNTASRGSTGAAGNITVNATDSLTISGDFTQLFSGSMEFSFGDAGHISISALSVVIENSGGISTSTSLVGNAGTITVDTNNLQLLSGGHITSSSLPEFPEFPSGAAGTVTIQGLTSSAQSVLIDGPGSGIFTNTQGTGAGGNIFVNANSVTMTNGATVSASSTGQVETPGDAGNIDITATNGFTMQNGAITTLAEQGASGGGIKVTTSPEVMVLLQNSLISASVADGDGGGGNISIDPQFVILQNSQILAQAAQGQGGAITITANLFLPDANSIVNADSGSGVNGTVTIQSPNAPISGQIQPLNKTPLPATSLLNQHCASVAGGQFSSFTVAGRDSLPTEPGSWLASPLYAAGVGTGEGLSGLSGVSGLSDVVRAGLATHQIDQTNQINQTNPVLLSLRQIAPAGFLTQAFAVDRSAGCQS